MPVARNDLTHRWIPEADTGDLDETVTVDWQNTTCTKATGGGTLAKASCGHDWNGGAISKRGFTGDISLQVQVVATLL